MFSSKVFFFTFLTYLFLQKRQSLESLCTQEEIRLENPCKIQSPSISVETRSKRCFFVSIIFLSKWQQTFIVWSFQFLPLFITAVLGKKDYFVSVKCGHGKLWLAYWFFGGFFFPIWSTWNCPIVHSNRAQCFRDKREKGCVSAATEISCWKCPPVTESLEKIAAVSQNNHRLPNRIGSDVARLHWQPLMDIKTQAVGH